MQSCTLHDIKTYGRVAVQLHSFLIPTLDQIGGEHHSSRTRNGWPVVTEGDRLGPRSAADILDRSCRNMVTKQTQ